MFSRKINNPLKITLDYERLGRDETKHNYFTNCDPIAGSVTLTLTEPQEVGKLWIHFYGSSKCSRKTPGESGASYRRVQPWLFKHDLSPPEINGFLDPGVHTWYFMSAFPCLTDASLVQDEKEKFNVSEEGFAHEAHPLPPSCRIETGHTSGLDTKTTIWYAINAEFTRIGGKPGKLMEPVMLQLDYVPMATIDHIESSIKTIYTSEVLEYRSVPLTSPSTTSNDPGKSLAWRDRIHSKLHKDTVPLHTFKLELMTLDQYTIDKPMPLYLLATHDPDGRSSFSHSHFPPIYILSSTIKYWTWNHIRGTAAWPFDARNEGDVEDPVCWGTISYSYKSDRKQKNSDSDPTNDVSSPPTIDTSTGMGTDLTSLSGTAYRWGRTPTSVPDFATYNVQTRQAVEVEVEVMVGAKKFDIAYQRQKYKWEKWLELKKVECVPLASGVTERQHKLKGEVEEGKNGDMLWWLIGDDRESYTFDPECEWKKKKRRV